MPRRHRRRDDPRAREAGRPKTTAPMAAPEGWTAERYRGSEGNDYVCPRCHRAVAKATEHVVAWRDGEDDNRRHWHSACFDSAVKEGIERYRWG